MGLDVLLGDLNLAGKRGLESLGEGQQAVGFVGVSEGRR